MTGFLLQSVYERYQVEREMAIKRAEAETELTDLQNRKESLQEEVEYLSQERGIEAEMRRQFDVALPGEQVIILVGDDTQDGEVAGVATTTAPKRPWYKIW